MNDKIKSQLQQREFAALKDQHRVLLKWATGCGKSKMTIDLINHIVASRNSSHPARILLIVAERAHIKNWQAEFEKWHLSFDKVTVDIICYASLKKAAEGLYGAPDVIIFDEAHHLFSEKRLSYAEDINNNMWGDSYVFMLSATLSANKQYAAEDIFGKFKISSITLKDAIESEILPDPKVYVIGMELDTTKENQEIEVRKGTKPMIVNWENRNKYKYKSTPYTIRCTQQQKYMWFTNEMEYWKERYKLSNNPFHRNCWVNLGSRRKRFLGELKTSVVRSLINALPIMKRYVCFCASISQAENLCAGNTLSSTKTTKKNQEIIDAFNNKKTNRIYAVGMITEGMNLTDIHIGIIVQLDGKERLFIQKFGRSMRAEDPVSFVFYYKNTQDEVYLKNALENIDPKYVQHLNINQLKSIKL